MALGAAACVRSPRPTALPDAPMPVRLGWRWVPGERHAWRTTVTRRVGPVAFTRAETWSYLARDLDPDGIVHLEGRLEAFDAVVEADGHPLPDARFAAARDLEAREVPREVGVALRLSGRLVGCSATGFGAALPHRLLAVHFPNRAVVAGDTWPDGGLARAFAPVLPIDADPRVVSSSTLTALQGGHDGFVVSLAHTARLQVGAIGPVMEVVGTTVWHTDPGVVASRRVEARWRPDVGDEDQPIGTLEATLERVDRV